VCEGYADEGEAFASAARDYYADQIAKRAN
jgi:hypothetical protein